ncbi:heterokaryon incompatibility 6 OR allele [Fusarium pseudoanthophilum]|uniref:Heterokaryon incompatibility 6 OR allele n=1 Tax=Fusarium pseudoanthophilum TaxID=48495 RepID=A0A8H5K9U3_9HYPO|nr:heterokaryon incompatibility 6 OR allele [Fusarium pseudoanthophilum]
MLSSDDSDSGITASSDSDTESIISESEENEEAGFDEIDHQLSDIDDGNQVSESVFLEGTESVLNLLFFGGGSLAGAIAHTSDTNGTTHQPRAQTADTENNLDTLDLGGDDTSSEANTAASHTNQGSNAVRALEASVYRDMYRDHLDMSFPAQNHGTTSNTPTPLVNVPHNPGFLEWLGRREYICLFALSFHIRVLLIQPGVNEATFELLDLNAASIRFEAISYQWSEGGNQKASIRLVGEKISINPYLRNILLHLRLEQHIRVLWADALCINQSDQEAHLQQVSIMQRIYSQALRVVGFVGKDYTHASMCFNVIKALTSAWFEVRKTLDQNDRSSSSPDNIYGCVQNEPSMGRIVEVFQSGYWKRL